MSGQLFWITAILSTHLKATHATQRGLTRSDATQCNLRNSTKLMQLLDISVAVGWQRCKKRQIWQIYLCYFFEASANFWPVHARTSAIITSGISVSAISTSAIITSGISTSIISTKAIITSAIYFCMMSSGANKPIFWLFTSIHRFVMVLLVIYAILSQIR